jgi:hypothetical protein
MSDNSWQRIDIVPYGAVLHVPAGWETLPPKPENGPEILRAKAGRHNLIVFKFGVAEGRTVTQVVDTVRDRLAAHGYVDFSQTGVPFAGLPGAALDFAHHNEERGTSYRSREYFALRGSAAFALGSATWADDLPLIERIAARFELA